MSKPEHHDVIVIGAGIAGLRCAHDLVHAKGATDVLVVDAMDRVGGRILADREFIPGMTVEVGAEFMHGANTSLTRLAEQQHWAVREIFTWAQADGGPTDPAPDGGVGYYYLGDQKRMLSYDDEDADFQRFNDCVSALSEPELRVEDVPADKSMLDYFAGDCELSASMMALADAGYANTAGGPLSDISMRVTCKYEKQWIELEDEGDFRVYPTFDRFIQHFSRGVTTKLSWPVGSVDYRRPDVITLTNKTTGETLTCSKLVVTVAISVFTDISYEPALPERKLESAASFGMRRAGKVLLHLKAAFWPADTHGVICSHCFLPEFWINSTRGIGELQLHEDDTYKEIITDDSEVQYLVTGFAGAETAERLTQVQESEIIRRFLDQLDTIYGTAEHPTPATASFVKGKYLDWGDVDYVRGGYSYPRVGQRDDAARDLAEPVDGRIFFAGEATAFEQPAMSVHASMDTGARAAEQVATALLP